VENQTETPKNRLFDLDKLAMQQGAAKPAPSANSSLNLTAFTLTELMQLRENINGRLPARKLAEIDLEEELVLQFQQAKELFNSVITDQNVPTNQRAQVANTCTALLEQLTKLQNTLYSSERVKAMELALVRAIRDLPEEQQVTFFATYEKAYSDAKAVK
jgi:uncharacterized protein (UPF0147 family)